jgi:hypothetical protein
MSQKTQKGPEKNAPEKNAGGENLQKGPPDFPVWQTHLADRIGVPVEDLRELRDQHLTQVVDWRFDSDSRVVLTEEAAQKLAGLILGVTNDARVPATLPPSALQATDAALKVHRAGPVIPNPRLLEAILDADNAHHPAGTVVCVRVRDNKQFRRGDAITARHHEGLFYDLTSGVPKRRV